MFLTFDVQSKDIVRTCALEVTLKTGTSRISRVA